MSVREVIQMVAADFGDEITCELLLSPLRYAHLVLPRHIAMYVIRQTGMSTTRIGRAVGHRDHSTVLHALRKIQHMIEEDPALAHRVRFLVSRARGEPVQLTAEGD